MREVSCRALAFYADYLKRRGLAPEAVLATAAHDWAFLSEPNNRIDWDEFVELTRRVGQICGSREELEALGRGGFDALSIRLISNVGKLIASPKRFYLWQHKFSHKLLFSNIGDAMVEVGEEGLRLEVWIEDGYAPCPEYFHISRGNLEAAPTVLGFPPSQVEMELSADGRRATYRITTRRSTTVWRRLGRLVERGRAVNQTVEEVERNQLQLEARYHELEQAKRQIENQQRALQAVHAISTASSQDLRLEATVAAIAEQVHQRLGFPLVHVRVDLVREERRYSHAVMVGDQSLVLGSLHREPLGVAGRELGYILVGRAEGELTAADKDVLRAVAESTALSVNNAAAYEVIRSYREELEKRVAARTAELSEARDQIARSLESRTRFFANVNHELRTPLTVLLLGLDRLAGLAALPPEARAQVGTMQRNAERLQSLVDDLLLLAAGAEGEGRLRLARVGAARVVAEVAEALRLQAEAKGLQLLEAADPALELEADARALDRALFNLASNAIKYTAHGRVELRARAEGGEAVFEVEDTGEGIPEDYLARVFERFVQVPGAKARPGAGIGLALVREIAAQHGGSVEAASAPGRGTRFTLRLPLRAGEAVRQRATLVAPEPAPEPARLPARVPTPPPAEAGAPARDAPLVLVCEDNPELAEQVRGLLLEAGLRVSLVHRAEEALARAAREPPDLLLTDVGLGTGMDGLELCRAFAELPGHRNAPCLVLTANSLPRSRLEAFEAGAVDFIIKPFSRSDLIARVRAQLQLRRLSLQLLASERLAAQGAALAGVAHELRNPLNGLINAVAPLRLTLPPEALAPGGAPAELLGVIEECGRRVAALSAELLSFARREPGPLEPLELGEVVGRALKVLGPQLARVELRAPAAYRGRVLASGGQLSQVVINLLDNAVAAAGEGGWVELRSREEGGRAVLEVVDSGPGVPAALRERIFEPFFTTKPPGQGTGLGLSISRSIVRRHGGELWVRSEGERTVFQLWLPEQAG